MTKAIEDKFLDVLQNQPHLLVDNLIEILKIVDLVGANQHKIISIQELKCNKKIEQERKDFLIQQLYSKNLFNNKELCHKQAQFAVFLSNFKTNSRSIYNMEVYERIIKKLKEIFNISVLFVFRDGNIISKQDFNKLKDKIEISKSKEIILNEKAFYQIYIANEIPSNVKSVLVLDVYKDFGHIFDSMEELEELYPEEGIIMRQTPFMFILSESEEFFDGKDSYFLNMICRMIYLVLFKRNE